MKLVNKLIFKAHENSPELLLAGGLIGIAAGTIMACKATPKAVKIMEDFNETKEQIKNCNTDLPDEKYNENDYKKDMALAYIQTALKIAKTYGLPIGIELLSMFMIIKGHGTLKKRCLKFAATAEMLRRHSNDICKEIESRYGKDVKDEIVNGIKAETISKEVEDDKGKKKKVKDTIGVVRRTDINSPYCHFFDASSREFEEDREYNLSYLKRMESYATDMLRARDYGKLTMNRVLEMLDLPQTPEGDILGWDKNDPESDDFVDFGIREVYVRNEEDNVEPVIMLTFNCCGRIVNI